MREKISQEISGPFCILPNQTGNRGSPWPLLAVLMIAGAAITGLGIWDLFVSLPAYSISILIIVVGGVLLFWAFTVLRTISSGDGYWLGCDSEKLTFMNHESVVNWLWAEVGPFRVTETVNSGFKVKHKPLGLDDEVNFRQTTTVALYSNALHGPPIHIPFNAFMPDGGRELDRAENFSTFLNDIRHRGLNGGLAQGASSFLVPIELNIVPMRNGAPAPVRGLSSTNAPAVQRQ